MTVSSRHDICKSDFHFWLLFSRTALTSTCTNFQAAWWVFSSAEKRWRCADVSAYVFFNNFVSIKFYCDHSFRRSHTHLQNMFVRKQILFRFFSRTAVDNKRKQSSLIFWRTALVFPSKNAQTRNNSLLHGFTKTYLPHQTA